MSIAILRTSNERALLYATATEVQFGILAAAMELQEKGTKLQLEKIAEILLRMSKAVNIIEGQLPAEFITAENSDRQHLLERAEAEKWDEKVLVPADLLGPLWPVGAPSGWGVDLTVDLRDPAEDYIVHDDHASDQDLERPAVRFFNMLLQCVNRTPVDYIRCHLRFGESTESNVHVFLEKSTPIEPGSVTSEITYNGWSCSV